jgi:hypothetical protein
LYGASNPVESTLLLIEPTLDKRDGGIEPAKMSKVLVSGLGGANQPPKTSSASVAAAGQPAEAHCLLWLPNRKRLPFISRSVCGGEGHLTSAEIRFEFPLSTPSRPPTQVPSVRL